MWPNSCSSYKTKTVKLNYKWNPTLYYVQVTSETYRKTKRMENDIQGTYTYQKKDGVARLLAKTLLEKKKFTIK